ncbi:MAG: DUF5063 domain-containing protein [Muribaculaceae bacterium]|nr:DUF5063 domain-containing protein [Muribaculaceae bacterium]
MNLSNNALSVIALANEYCRAVELAASTEPLDFVARMVKLLPRLFIAVNDLPDDMDDDADFGFDSAHLDEEYYNQVRAAMAATLGEADSYLETMHEDMKYSDSPIAATISEGLADIFQVLYDFVEDVRDGDSEQVNGHLSYLREQYAEYWSETLCNVMRPLNAILRHPDDYFTDDTL